jgi:hypothetical protein
LLNAAALKNIYNYPIPGLQEELAIHAAQQGPAIPIFCISWAARIAHGSWLSMAGAPLQPRATSQASPASQHPAGRRSSDGLVNILQLFIII